MERMRLPAVLIEAFAASACQGNGAAVVKLREPLGPQAMQAIAGSLRQSETAFLLPWQGRWLLRWFTPSCEVKLCGHATLASLLALGHWGDLEAGASLVFQSRSGPLAVSLAADQEDLGAIVLPSSPLAPAAPTPELVAELEQRCGRPVSRYWTSALGYHVALLPPGTRLHGLDGLDAQLHGPERGGLVVMAAVDPTAVEFPLVQGQRADYQLRFFAPGLGIPEDPVTGSAHALVAPWWLESTGKPAVVGWQPSTHPGGMVCSSASSGMIRLLGTGHLLWDGTLHFEPSSLGDGSVSATSARDGWVGLLPRG